MKVSVKSIDSLLQTKDLLNAAVGHIELAASDPDATPEDVMRGCAAVATLAWDMRGKVSTIREECIAAGLIRNTKPAAKKAVQA